MRERKSQNQKGVGLIEMMIYVVLSVIVLTSIYRLLDSNRATYASGESKMNAQQNARVGVDEIDRELRMAGYYPENFDADPANNITLIPCSLPPTMPWLLQAIWMEAGPPVSFCFVWMAPCAPGKSGRAAHWPLIPAVEEKHWRRTSRVCDLHTTT